eukprot:CAMPEP_0174837376 /NCGR_PEP_ID=MMETSP1114-20130205/6703_1 /TAXON_ID=312471 /ORGANISM="Neobodo designis, Strain CCAP 1951/1" /LENGTH=629 /DNA_ID=CAMNT_0016071441 /DNA_START=138 /DNA_END=2023 /DNA_ORIENTATION=-
MPFAATLLPTVDAFYARAQNGIREFKRPRALEEEDARHWRRHGRERRRALRGAPEGERGNLFEDSVTVLQPPPGGDDADGSSFFLDAASAPSVAPDRRAPAKRTERQPRVLSPTPKQSRREAPGPRGPTYAVNAAPSAARRAREAAAAAEVSAKNNDNPFAFGRPPAKPRASTRLAGMGSPAPTFDLNRSSTIADASSRAGAPASGATSGRPTLQLSGSAGDDAASTKAAIREQQLRLLEAHGTKPRHPQPQQRGRSAETRKRPQQARTVERDVDEDDDAARSSPLVRQLRSVSADLSSYRRALSDAVATVAEGVAASKMGKLVGATRASLAERVRRAAGNKCRPARGVLKAIKAQRPYTVPIELDADDQRALAKLARVGREELVINRLDFNIRAYQLRSLEGTTWLNDQVINLYCAMVAESFPDRVATLGSFLYTKLNAGGDPATLRNDALRWTLDKDVFAVPKVLIVINDGVHWTLAVLNTAAGRLEYYDSMGGAGDRVLDRLAAFFDAEYDVKREALKTSAERAAIVTDEGGGSAPADDEEGRTADAAEGRNAAAQGGAALDVAPPPAAQVGAAAEQQPRLRRLLLAVRAVQRARRPADRCRLRRHAVHPDADDAGAARGQVLASF